MSLIFVHSFAIRAVGYDGHTLAVPFTCWAQPAFLTAAQGALSFSVFGLFGGKLNH